MISLLQFVSKTSFLISKDQTLQHLPPDVLLISSPGSCNSRPPFCRRVKRFEMMNISVGEPKASILLSYELKAILLHWKTKRSVLPYYVSAHHDGIPTNFLSSLPKLL